MKKYFKILALVLSLILSLSIVSFAISPSFDDDYPQVYDLYWSGKVAKWSVDGEADKYEVRLYRDGRRVCTKTTTGRSRNFTSEMTRGDHEYYFEVRPFNYYTGWGNWEESDSKYIHSSGSYDPYNPTPIYPSGGPGESSNIPVAQIIYSPVGQWVTANNYWHFQYSNGVYASNSWLLINNKWYYVDINTNMAVGLVNIAGSNYYFNPDGTMITGGIIINGINHYFDSNGKMVY